MPKPPSLWRSFACPCWSFFCSSTVGEPHLCLSTVGEPHRVPAWPPSSLHWARRPTAPPSSRSSSVAIVRAGWSPIVGSRGPTRRAPDCFARPALLGTQRCLGLDANHGSNLPQRSRQLRHFACLTHAPARIGACQPALLPCAWLVLPRLVEACLAPTP